MLIRERPRLTTALEKLGTLSDTASGLVNDTQADLVTNLQNLEPTLKALADVGPDIDTALAYIPTFPLTQNLIDRGVRGDYVNLFVTVDLTNSRIKRGLLLGTRLGQDRASMIPAPGDPGYDAYYTKFPLGVGTSPPFGPIPERRRGAMGTRGWRLMLTRFVRIQLARLHDRLDRRRAGDGVRLHAGADLPRHRPHHRQAGTARVGWAVPVLAT